MLLRIIYIGVDMAENTPSKIWQILAKIRKKCSSFKWTREIQFNAFSQRKNAFRCEIAFSVQHRCCRCRRRRRGARARRRRRWPRTRRRCSSVSSRRARTRTRRTTRGRASWPWPAGCPASRSPDGCNFRSGHPVPPKFEKRQNP